MLKKTGIIISIALGLILASAAICVSIILFSKGSQKKLTGLTGILANTLLLIGDFTVGSRLPSRLTGRSRQPGLPSFVMVGSWQLNQTAGPL